MGDPGFPNVDQDAFEYTSTKSIFRLSVAGKIAMEVTFLSPVTPNDFKRQALVGSYMDVVVRSLDGQAHDVQLYSDISAEWASGDRDAVAEWKYDVLPSRQSNPSTISVHRVWRQQQLEFDESDKPDGNGMANWGQVWYATASIQGTTRMSGSDRDCRQTFSQKGWLDGGLDHTFRRITDQWPVFAFARDLGRVGSNPISTLYSIGINQKNAVQFLGNGGLHKLPSLWTSYLSEDDAVISSLLMSYNRKLTTMNR
jgi:hypothetical protein